MALTRRRTLELLAAANLAPQQLAMAQQQGARDAQNNALSGDVIVEVQQEAVNSPADVQKRLEAQRKQNRRSVLLLIQSQDGRHWVPLPLSGGEGQQRRPG